MVDRVRVVQNYVKESIGSEVLKILFDIILTLATRLMNEVIEMINRRISTFVGATVDILCDVVVYRPPMYKGGRRRLLKNG